MLPLRDGRDLQNLVHHGLKTVNKRIAKRARLPEFSFYSWQASGTRERRPEVGLVISKFSDFHGPLSWLSRAKIGHFIENRIGWIRIGLRID
jgi:hypothetical protein